MDVPSAAVRLLNGEDQRDLRLCENNSAAEIPLPQGAEKLFQIRGFPICNSSVFEATSLQKITLPLLPFGCPSWRDGLPSRVISGQISLEENLVLAKSALNHRSCLKDVLLKGGFQGSPGPTSLDRLVPLGLGTLSNWSNTGDNDPMWSFWWWYCWFQSPELFEISFETSEDEQSFVLVLQAVNLGHCRHWFLTIIRFITLFDFLSVLVSGFCQFSLKFLTRRVPVISGSSEDYRKGLSIFTAPSTQSELLKFLVLVKLFMLPLGDFPQCQGNERKMSVLSLAIKGKNLKLTC